MYVAPEIASDPTSEPTVTVTLGVGSVPLTIFDLLAALMVMARGEMVKVTEFEPASQNPLPE